MAWKGWEGCEGREEQLRERNLDRFYRQCLGPISFLPSTKVTLEH